MYQCYGAEDQKALEEGVISEVRPQNELLRQALSLVRPIPGRREAFEAHIRSCERIPRRPRIAPATIYNLLSKEQQDEFNFDLCRLATGMSDGWKNVRRNALIASMLSVDYKTYTVCVHDLSAQHKTAENHLKLVLSDIDKTKKEHNVRVIAWVSDAGGDSRAMRVRLHRLRPHILVFDCWAHQINLVVGDIMSLTSRLVDTADDAINIIKSKPEMAGSLAVLHFLFSLDGPHILSFRSLLSESRSLRALAARNPEEFRASAGRTPELVQQAETVLKNIDDPEFWLRLNELKLYLEPLAIAANVSQAATTRLDHILVELGRLYYTFSNLGFNPKIRECVLESLERRWGKADQDPFILARVFRRVFCKENDLELYEAFLDYYDSRNEFHPDRWDYEEQRAMHERAGKPLNMIHVWSGLLAYETPNSGRHQLAHLAIHVLSIVANSAGCERLFSEMGHIHTKRRNRLGYQKVFDTAVVRMDLKRKHADEGRTRSRLKRQFGSPALDSVVSGAGAKRNNQPDELAESIGDVDAIEEELVTPSVRSLITQLRQDVLDDEDPLDDEPDEPPVATLPKRFGYFSALSFLSHYVISSTTLFPTTFPLGFTNTADNPGPKGKGISSRFSGILRRSTRSTSDLTSIHAHDISSVYPSERKAIKKSKNNGSNDSISIKISNVQSTIPAGSTQEAVADATLNIESISEYSRTPSPTRASRVASPKVQLILSTKDKPPVIMVVSSSQESEQIRDAGEGFKRLAEHTLDDDSEVGTPKSVAMELTEDTRPMSATPKSNRINKIRRETPMHDLTWNPEDQHWLDRLEDGAYPCDDALQCALKYSQITAKVIRSIINNRVTQDDHQRAKHNNQVPERNCKNQRKRPMKPEPTISLDDNEEMETDHKPDWDNTKPGKGWGQTIAHTQPTNPFIDFDPTSGRINPNPITPSILNTNNPILNQILKKLEQLDNINTRLSRLKGSKPQAKPAQTTQPAPPPNPFKTQGNTKAPEVKASNIASALKRDIAKPPPAQSNNRNFVVCFKTLPVTQPNLESIFVSMRKCLDAANRTLGKGRLTRARWTLKASLHLSFSNSASITAIKNAIPLLMDKLKMPEYEFGPKVPWSWLVVTNVPTGMGGPAQRMRNRDKLL
ncbi:hypothetical protein RhiXN_00048 [Rhizoctonia solani]|uniref:HAT C-terminal dimerisation domain-containing protein n=1 Tax=Rhizoctonia solani TaxID=456999 RepID=A0A8H8SVN5_9AGAM|nr:uncharacterized protein RhiXN_00048 [Rhizoctonia solani]QRW18642.1 hypothetical protein RhiXN_00048 [Rhizoctonia solani]